MISYKMVNTLVIDSRKQAQNLAQKKRRKHLIHHGGVGGANIQSIDIWVT